MKSIQNILVAYDFSECSKRALLEAIHLAQKTAAKVSVFNVIDADISEVFSVPLTKDWTDKVRANVHKDLSESCDQGVSESIIKDVTVEIGTSYKKIVSHAMAMNADLIILGSHSRSKLGYVFLGSTADKVVRYSPVPVMVCRLDRARAFSKILVPLDDSLDSQGSIAPAKYFADLYHAELQLMSAIDLKEYYYLAYEDVLNKVQVDTLARLNKIRTDNALSLAPLVQEGNASHSIVDLVRDDVNIGLVALMTHGRTGFKHLMLGSTAEAVVRYAPCSVLTIPTPDHVAKIKTLESALKGEKVTLGNVLI